MLPTLGGSYEESPPSLIDLAARDRRWCQGNLQHARVLPTSGLAFPSRLPPDQRHHGLSRFARCGCAIADRASCWCCSPSSSVQSTSPPSSPLFPTWPRFDYERALQFVRIDDRRPARAQGVRHDRRRGGSADAARLRRAPFACSCRPSSKSSSRGARFDHDGDPVGRGAARSFGSRHRLEPAAARRRARSPSPPSSAATARHTALGFVTPAGGGPACRLRWWCGCRRPSPASSCRSRCRGRAAKRRSAFGLRVSAS